MTTEVDSKVLPGRVGVDAGAGFQSHGVRVYDLSDSSIWILVEELVLGSGVWLEWSADVDWCMAVGPKSEGVDPPEDPPDPDPDSRVDSSPETMALIIPANRVWMRWFDSTRLWMRARAVTATTGRLQVERVSVVASTSNQGG